LSINGKAEVMGDFSIGSAFWLSAETKDAQLDYKHSGAS
jgi:hypothetical protein